MRRFNIEYKIDNIIVFVMFKQLNNFFKIEAIVHVYDKLRNNHELRLVVNISQIEY